MIRRRSNRAWVPGRGGWLRIPWALAFALCALPFSCGGDEVTRRTNFLPTEVTDSQGAVEFKLATARQEYVVVDEGTAGPVPWIVTRAAETEAGVGLLLVDQSGEYLSVFTWADGARGQIHLPRARWRSAAQPSAICVLPGEAGGALLQDFMRLRSTVALVDLGDAVKSVLSENEAWEKSGVVHLVDRTPHRSVGAAECWSFTTFEVEMPGDVTDWYEFYRGIWYADSDRFEVWTPWHPFLAQVLVLPVADEVALPGPELTLEGTARDSETGQPVANVTLHLQPGGLCTTTDASGFFSFDSVDLHCGGFRGLRLVACCKGYERTSLGGEDLDLELGVRNQVDIVLRPPREPGSMPSPTPDPTPGPSGSVARVFVELYGNCFGSPSDPRPDLAKIRIENRSSAGVCITEIEMTIGDLAYTFDTFYKDAGLMDFRLLEPDDVHMGERSSRFVVVFPGSNRFGTSVGVKFEPGDVLECRADIDPGNVDSKKVNFTTVLYNNGASENSVLTIRLSNGATLSKSWPDNGDTVHVGDKSSCELEHSMLLTSGN